MRKCYKGGYLPPLNLLDIDERKMNADELNELSYNITYKLLDPANTPEQIQALRAKNKIVKERL